MLASFTLRPLVAACFVVGLFGTLSDCGRSVFGATPEPTPPAVELFAAIEAGRAEVRVIPRDSKVVNLLVRNLSEKPLRLEMPAALAAAPIAAQPGNGLFPGANDPFGNNNNGGNNSQAIGLPGGQQNNNNVPFGNPFMNIPAGREIKVRLACVCLEHGKPEPSTRIVYELKPLADYTTDARAIAAVAGLGKKGVNQRVVQLAVWNLVNDKSWEDLAAKKIKHIGRFDSPMFQPSELESAQALVQHLQEQLSSASETSGR